MNSIDLTSMFLLGLFGTGHCLGMCGPLIFAFPAAAGRFAVHLYYHLGRSITYVVVGMIVGGLGAGVTFIAAKSGADPLAWTARVQVGFSFAAALFLLVFGLARLQFLPEPGWMNAATPSRIPGFRGACNGAVHRKTNGSMLLIGLMLGFLPCGLSYAAFARALGAGGPVAGGALLAAFAAGTVPGLLLLGTGMSGVAARYRRYSDPVSGMIMIGMAAMLFVDAWQAVV